MKYFEVHIVEHCNLKCQSCDNYSSIAEEEFLDEQIFKNDMERMSELFPNIKCFRLLGGEPLLHPNISFFISTARHYFPNTEIKITTNGILLGKMPEIFWTTCHDNNIIIEYTYYPINIDRKLHKELAEKYDVQLFAFNNVTDNKTSYRFPVNDKKDQDSKYNYLHCFRAVNCASLKHGKIYPCTCVPNICHFNKFFNKNLEVTDNDYIDIYEHTANEIDNFLMHPIPFCSYCDLNRNEDEIPWSVTKFNIKEWMVR